MEILKNKLENKLNIRTQKNYPIEGIEFIDIIPLFMKSEILNEIIEKMVDEIIKYDVDYILVPEARGFLIGSAIAKELGIGIVVARKKGKIPTDFVESCFEYEKEYGKDYLELPKLDNQDYINKKFYIVDDIYATGNTMKSIKKEVEKLGGKILGSGVIINIPDLNKEKNIFSLIDIKET